jgi:hypothetical protein
MMMKKKKEEILAFDLETAMWFQSFEI